MGTNDVAEMLAAAQAEVVRLEHQVTELQEQLAVNSWWRAVDPVRLPPAGSTLAIRAEQRILELLNIGRGIMSGIADQDGIHLRRFPTDAFVAITLVGKVDRTIADQMIAEAGRTS